MVFIPTGQASVTLNITGWNGDHDGLLFEVTHTGHGGHCARISGRDDWKGTVQADFDLDAPPYLSTTPNIRFGTTGIIRKFVSTTKFIQVPVVIAKVHYESAVQSQLKYSFDVAMSVLAGTMVYPT